MCQHSTTSNARRLLCISSRVSKITDVEVSERIEIPRMFGVRSTQPITTRVRTQMKNVGCNENGDEAGECRPCRRKVCVNTNPAKEHQIYSHPLRGSVEPLEVPCKNAQPRYDERKSQSCLERSQIG